MPPDKIHVIIALEDSEWLITLSDLKRHCNTVLQQAIIISGEILQLPYVSAQNIEKYSYPQKDSSKETQSYITSHVKTLNNKKMNHFDLQLH